MTRVPDQSKSAIDRIGDQLKAGNFDIEVLKGLDMFRSSHDRIVPMVLHAVSRTNGVLSLRAAKSTASIVAKLRRDSVRLSQIQDIAGCRLIVPDAMMQAELVEAGFDFIESALKFRSPDAPLGYRIVPTIGITFRRIDGSVIEPEYNFRPPVFEPVASDVEVKIKEINRLANPHFGYRAVHVVVGYRSRFMEVQIRTQLQHAWAELSEKAADKYGHELKYGYGDAIVLEKLTNLSREIAFFEDQEIEDYYDDDKVDELETKRQHILDVLKSEAFDI